MEKSYQTYYEPLQEQAHIWNQVFSFINSMSLKCAVELRIADAIDMHDGQPVTLSRLASQIGIPPSKVAFLPRLMRLLTHNGFFTTQRTDDGEETYLLTNLSKHLVWKNSLCASPFVLTVLDQCIVQPCQSFSTWFRGDSPSPFHHINGGTSFWQLASQRPDINEMFNMGMSSDSHLTTSVLIQKYRGVFHGLKSLVDVGGGNGTTAMALAKAFPHLNCMVLELSHVVASAPEGTAVEFREGDMFESIPPADAILLKCILHDWSDEHCVKLLNRCKEAIPPMEKGGKVIVIDMVLSEDVQPKLQETQYLFDLLMMAFNGGKERTEEEWQKLVVESGFSGYKIIGDLGLRSILELYP